MWQLVINGPGYFDTAYDLPEGVTSLGRADENDVILSGDLVSRRHVKLHVKGDSISVEDLGSRNGSRVNADPLHGTRTLKPGDTIHVGENALAVRKVSGVDAVATEVLSLTESGIRRVEEGLTSAPNVVLSKNVTESVVLRALDNFVPASTRPLYDTDPAVPVQPAVEPAAPGLTFETLALLYKTVERLTTARSLRDFLTETVDQILERIDATTAVVLLRGQRGALIPAAIRHRGQLAQGETPVSDGIVNQALSSGSALVVAHANQDARFAARESVIAYSADQVLCIPLGRKTPFSGVLYLTRSAKSGENLEALLELCTAMAQLIQTAVEKSRADLQTTGPEKHRRTLERQLPAPFVDRKLADMSGGESTSSFEERQATLVCVELPNLHATVAKAKPIVAAQILSAFHDKLARVVRSFEGTIERLAGESMVVLFGLPYPHPDDAMRATRCAVAIRTEWGRAMRALPAELRPEPRIGIATGRLIGGWVGSDAQLAYVVAGEAAQQALALTQSALPGQVLLTGKTLAGIGARFDVTPLGERALKTEKMAVFELLGEDLDDSTLSGIRPRTS